MALFNAHSFEKTNKVKQRYQIELIESAGMKQKSGSLLNCVGSTVWIDL
jgi:hypothetical protein